MTGAPPPTDAVLSATERALSIPEILERILSFLPGKARDRVGTLVCKSWHALLCCQQHENHHRYPRHLVHNIYSKDWRTNRQSYGDAHGKTTAIGSARGGLFDVRFGSWTDQVAPPKFEYPDVPAAPKAVRKNRVFSKARDVFAYPVKPCILRSAQWPTRLSPRIWQHRNDWAHLRFGHQIRDLAFVAPDPTAEKASWLDYLDGLGALHMILTGDNSCMAAHGPMPTSCAAERWQARKDLLAALQTLSRPDSSQIATNNGYKPREKFALLELEILYLDLTYPRLQSETDSGVTTPVVPNEASLLPPANGWPGDPGDEPVATGDDYEMFLRPLTSVPGVSCHLQRLVLKHLMVWPGNAQSSNRRRRGRRTQRQKRGEGLEDDEGLFPIGPMLSTCRQLEELTIEVDDQCAKVGRHSDWPSHWKKPRVTLVLFIDGACDEDDGGEMKEPEIVDVSELGDEPNHSQQPCWPPEVLSGLKLKKLRLKDIHVPEVVLQSLIRASPSLTDLWFQAPMTTSSLLTEDLTEQEPRHNFGPNVTCDQMGFFRELGAQWPQLTRLHFSKSGHRYTAAQMRTILKAFPNTNRWAIGWKDLGDGILEDLNRIIAKGSLNRSVLDREELQVGSSNSNSGQSHYRAPGLYSNFLTSLDIVPAKDWSPQWGDVMHVFLCEAWHLEYLRAGSIGCYVDNLDLNGVLQTEGTASSEGSVTGGAGGAGGGSIDEDGGPFSSTRRRSDTGQYEPGPMAVWACRNLKHLQIEFTRRWTPRRAKYLSSRRRLSYTSSHSGGVADGPMPTVGSYRRNALHPCEFLKDEEKESEDPEKTSRIIFGYLARFCPHLHEVSIRCYELTLKLRGGFTLLTRIQTLKKISIVRFTTGLEERDVLPWVIKKSTSQSPTEASSTFTRGLGLVLKGVGLTGLNRPSKIMERATGVARRSICQQEMRKLRRESENELRTIFGKSDLSGINKAENTDRNGNGFSNTKGAHWMCTVPKECYKDLGYLRDVVHVLSDLVEQGEPKPELPSKATPPFEGNDAETWPDLVRLRFIYIDEPLQRRFIAPLLRKYRPELDFEWENWNHDDRT